MRYKYYFCELSRPDLVEWLEKNSIHYNQFGGDVVPEMVRFSFWSTNKNYEKWLLQLEEIHINRPMVTVEYTPAELSEAKLLEIRPRKQNINIINRQQAYRYSCQWINPAGIKKVGHKEQLNIFAISKEPSNKTQTAFWLADTGYDEIFTDNRIVDLVNRNQLTGIEFKNVSLRNGEYSRYIYQIKSNNIIGREYFSLENGVRTIRCPLCEKEQYSLPNTYQFHINHEVLETQSDMYMTERIFGEGIPYPIYFISQRFYQLLISNNLAGNLVLIPVVESSD